MLQYCHQINLWYKEDCKRYLRCSPQLRSIWSKRCKTWELWVKFYWGQNEDCSLGDSIPGSSERFLQRGTGRRSIYEILMKGRVLCNQMLILQKVFCWLQEANVSMKGFSDFLDMKGSKDSDHKISFWKYLKSKDQVPPVSLGHRVPPSPHWIPLGGVAGQQQLQHRVQSPQRQTANTLLVVQFLAKIFGKC